MIRSQRPVRTAVASAATDLEPMPTARTSPAALASARAGMPGGDAALEVVLVRIVQVGDVDPLGADPLQALGQRPSDPGRAGIPDPPVGGRHHEALVVSRSAPPEFGSSSRPTLVESRNSVARVARPARRPAGVRPIRARSAGRCRSSGCRPPRRRRWLRALVVGDLVEEVADAGRPEPEPAEIRGDVLRASPGDTDQGRARRPARRPRAGGWATSASRCPPAARPSWCSGPGRRDRWR